MLSCADFNCAVSVAASFSAAETSWRSDSVWRASFSSLTDKSEHLCSAAAAAASAATCCVRHFRSAKRYPMTPPTRTDTIATKTSTMDLPADTTRPAAPYDDLTGATVPGSGGRWQEKRVATRTQRAARTHLSGRGTERTLFAGRRRGSHSCASPDSFVRALAPCHGALAPSHRALAPSHRALAPSHRALAPPRRALAPCHRALAPPRRALAPCRRALAPCRRALAPCDRALAPFNETAPLSDEML